MQKSEPQEKSLSQKVARGGFWVFYLKIIDKILGIIRLIILARILSPNDFGLLGIALLTIAVLETFSQTGFQAALVQKKKNITNYLDTVWTVSIIRSFILFILLLLSAPYVALFFNSTKASLIIQVIGVSILFRGFTNIGVVYFQKELEFNKQFVYQLSTTLAEFIVAVSAALILRNVWALVYGGLASSIVGLIASYLVHPYRPHFNLDLEKSKELFGFGKWVLGSSILVFLITQGDDAFVGKLLGVTMLGFYQMAYRISNMPATEITHIISQVTFPAYSKMQEDIHRLKEAYLRVLQVTAFLSFPIAGLIFILAPDFTMIFLGEKWMPMVPAMQILVLAGLVRSIQATTGPIFLAINRPKIEPRWQTVRLLVLIILIYPLSINWGILGTSIAVFFSTFVSTLGFGFMVLKVTKCEIPSFYKIIILPFINALFMVLILMILKNSAFLTGICQFILSVGAGIISYLFVTYIFDKILDYGMRRLIKENLVLR